MAPDALATETTTNGKGVKSKMLLKADNIALRYERLEREVIPLGTTNIEVELGEIPIEELRLDPTNPRVQFKLEAMNIPNPTQEQLRELLWADDDVKRLMRSIKGNGGLIEAIIVSGKDGTVLEGNCRLTCFFKLRDDPEAKDSSLWKKIRARILPPDVTREMVDVLLGELHVAGKNKWSPFEQAAHLYRMNKQKGFSEQALAEMYRESKTYISAKIRAYRLMAETFVETAKERKQELKDLPGKWSWFDEFFKKVRPSGPGRENPDRIYDGPQLEEKFSQWVLDGKLPKAEDVRKLPDILTDKKAVNLLETAHVNKAFDYIAARKPAVGSKLWRQIEATTALLLAMPLEEIDAIREDDVAKGNAFEALVKAVEKIKKELKK
jgi:hypothetical protein